MSLDREPGFKATYAKIHEWQTNAIANSLIWRVVQAVLDTVEEQLLVGRAFHTSYWVIMRDDKPLAVCVSRARARRWVKIIMVNESRPRSDYIIRETPIGE